MTRPAIIINELDAERIDRLLEQPAFANSPVADALNEELDRAQMLAPEAMPHDVVTMNQQGKIPRFNQRRRARADAGVSVTGDRQRQPALRPRAGGRRAAGPESRQHHSLGAAGRRIDAPGSAGAIVPAGSRWRIPPLIPLPEAFRALFRGCPHILFLLFSRRLPFFTLCACLADSFAT